MKTTIQISEKTLLLLKRLKHELQASSYEEAITEVAKERKRISFAGSLKREYQNQPLKKILRGLREKNDRF